MKAETKDGVHYQVILVFQLALEDVISLHNGYLQAVELLDKPMVQWLVCLLGIAHLQRIRFY